MQDEKKGSSEITSVEITPHLPTQSLKIEFILVAIINQWEYPEMLKLYKRDSTIIPTT